MTEDNLTPEQQAILNAAHAAPAAINPYQPPGAPENAAPRPQFSQAQPAKYKPWTRAMTYVVFGLGMGAAGFLMFCILPHAIAMGWFALGCGIPAVLLAKKEIGRFPEAEHHGFIKWGKRMGLLGIIIVSAIGFNF